MRSAPDDRTAIARIRDAAIDLWGQHGFNVGLRTIAEAAGVSAALVIHHFGSKDGLRKACDDHIAELVRESKTESMRTTDPANWLAQVAEIEDYAPMMAYLVRSMQSGSDLAKSFWQRMIDNAEQYIEEGVAAGILKPSRDPKARARYLSMINGGGFLLYLQMHENPTDLRAVLRDYGEDMMLPALEMFTNGLMADSTMYDAFLAQREKGIPFTSREGDGNDDSATSLQRANAGERSRLAVEIRGLSKSFGRTKALDGLDLMVAPGDITGFLGPNGAGKSTTIRVLLGLLRADGGTVRLLGGDPWHDAVALHRRIAYVPGDVTLWPNLTGLQAIDFLARLRGNGVDTRRRDQLIERFELDPHKKARTYSKGNRQKVAIVAAFSTNAELYILDEPTSGLDPLMEKAFQQCVEEVAERGAAVLLSSHILAEVEKLCDNVTIIRAGRTVKSGTLDELRHLMRTTVTVRTSTDGQALQRSPFVHDFAINDGHYTFSVERNELDRAMGQLTELGILDLTVTPASLEDMFLREYQGATR